MTKKIKAPFNFVPLYSDVYCPNWARQISHDIPFEDGLSGVIDLQITAQTPIFVRNGHTKEDYDVEKQWCSERYLSFSNIDGKYFIPASSIQGVVRNVLEIMSFGKMTRVQDQKFSIRDLNDSGYVKTVSVAHCGWLRKKGVNEEGKSFYELQDCGEPWRISAEELDRRFGFGFERFVKTGDFKDDENRTAFKKYKTFKDATKYIFEEKYYFVKDSDLVEKKGGTRKFVKFEYCGKEGRIIYTGQSSQRKNGVITKGVKDAKYFEFVFPCVDTPYREVNESAIKEFLSIHKETEDYKKMWKQKLNDGDSIPVFFTYKEDGKTVDAIGLSYLFRYPAHNSVYNGIDIKLFGVEHDLAESIFGYVDGSVSALKGRVSFSHAFAVNTPVVLPTEKYILNSPKPSYYPLYLGDGYTWNSEDIKLAGRKRYPVRNKIMKSTEGTEKMAALFNPLDKGVVFSCKMRYHNLKPIELGALLSAITFHNNGECSHNVGMAKPYGFGRVKIEVLNDDYLRYLADFEDEMNRFASGQWREWMKELFAMAKGIPAGREEEFKYMDMSTNEFVDAKKEYKEGKQLGTFTQIINGEVPSAKVRSAAQLKERQNMELYLENQKKRREELAVALQKVEDLINNGDYDKAEREIAQARDLNISSSRLDELYDRLLQCREQERNEKEQITKALLSEAESLRKEGKYEQAIRIYEQLDSIMYYNEIEECRKLASVSSCSFEDYVEERPFSSANALKSRIKKWKEQNGELTDEQKNYLEKKVQDHIESLNKNKAKEWLNFKI